eukprot:6407698-Prymnesium_polylepis.1
MRHTAVASSAGFTLLLATPLVLWRCSQGSAVWDSWTREEVPLRVEHYECCERLRLNAPVRAPTNAWSSVAFLYPLGEVMARSRGLHHDQPAGALTVLLAASMAATGYTSFFNHGSVTWRLLRLDMEAIYFMLNIFFAAVLTPALLCRDWTRTLWAVWIAAATLTAVELVDYMAWPPGAVLFQVAGLYVPTCMLVAAASGEPDHKHASTRRWLLMHLVLLLTAFTFKALDDRSPHSPLPAWLRSMYCDPASIFQPTAAFHVVIAASLYFAIGAIESMMRWPKVSNGGMPARTSVTAGHTSDGSATTGAW